MPDLLCSKIGRVCHDPTRPSPFLSWLVRGCRHDLRQRRPGQISASIRSHLKVCLQLVKIGTTSHTSVFLLYRVPAH